MKKAQKFLLYTALSAVLFSMWVLSGCSSSKGDPAPTLTISALIATSKYKESSTVTDDKALDSLVKYLTLYPDLEAVLGGTDKYTLFAPSNKAFKNLLATPGFPANIKLINPALIQGVLYYHIIAGQELSSALKSGASFNSLYPSPTAGEAIVINSDGTLKTGSSNPAVHITVADQKATNGVFHIIESVLIPPTIGASLTPILGTIAGTVLLGADFTDLAAIIAKADANFTESATPNPTFKITTWLAMPITGTTVTANQNGITFFAIPNAVFQAAAVGAGVTESQLIASFTASADAARGLLLNHLSVTKEYSTTGTFKFSLNPTIPTLGKTIAVTVGSPSTATGPYGIVFANSTPSGAYLAKEVTPAASNGQLQVIAGILK